jgi:rfaE bifunctional protein nucleotidyltransferase chain/domain
MSKARIDKVVRLDTLGITADRARQTGHTLALCHGCFDLVHIGHIHHLQVASAWADILVISVSQDQYCAKGPSRPAFSVQDRMDFLAALEVVDYVCMSPDATAVQVIETIKPHFFVKGPDYRAVGEHRDHGLWVEAMAVKRGGGTVRYTDAECVSSSTYLALKYGAPQREQPISPRRPDG